MTKAAAGFETSWKHLEPPIRRSLELSYAALVAGGLACGAVLTDPSGDVIAEGRNRAYDAPTRDARLSGTPIAHAEMNALARVEMGRDLSTSTLWTTQEPCSMCTSAMAFCGVGTARFIAPDPWAVATGRSRLGGAAGLGFAAGLPVVGPVGDEAWIVAANTLFMMSIGRARGADHPTIAGNAVLEPETTRVVLLLLAKGETRLPTTLHLFLARSWEDIVAAADDRRGRVGVSA